MSGFCEQCGTALGENAKFCAACGTQVTSEGGSRDAAPPQPVAPDTPTTFGGAGSEPGRGAERVSIQAARKLAYREENAAKKKNWFQRHKILTGILALIVLVAVISAASKGNGSGSSRSSANNPSTTTSTHATTAASKPAIPQSEKDARDWINHLGSDAGKVQANLGVVQIAVALAVKHPTTSNVDKLAQYAQQAHGSGTTLRSRTKAAEASAMLSLLTFPPRMI